MDPNRDRLKQIDMLGALGAGVLGAGLALLFADFLRPFAVPALLIGILAHGWAMYQKNRLERQANLKQPAWETVAYWTCWVMLGGLVLYVVFSVLD